MWLAYLPVGESSASPTSDAAASPPAQLLAGLLACRVLEAAVRVHAHHFGQQQQQERRFVRHLRSICSDVPSRDFAPALYKLLKPMQAAIIRHTHSVRARHPQSFGTRHSRTGRL